MQHIVDCYKFLHSTIEQNSSCDIIEIQYNLTIIYYSNTEHI